MLLWPVICRSIVSCVLFCDAYACPPPPSLPALQVMTELQPTLDFMAAPLDPKQWTTQPVPPSFPIQVRLCRSSLQGSALIQGGCPKGLPARGPGLSCGEITSGSTWASAVSQQRQTMQRQSWWLISQGPPARRWTRTSRQ